MNRSRAAINSRLTVTRGEPLLAYLLSVLEPRRAAVKNLLKFGAVRVNGATVRQFDHLLVPGDEVTVGDLHAAAAIGKLERARIRPVYEDGALIVVEKPAGLLTVATECENADTLFARLNAYLSGRNSARPECAGSTPARPGNLGTGAVCQERVRQALVARRLAHGGKDLLRRGPRAAQPSRKARSTVT